MANSDPDLFQFSFHAMGSPCRIHFYDKDEHQARSRFGVIQQQINRLESRYSRYIGDNLLATINLAADAGGSLEVDDEVLALLQYADTCYQQSDGLFDITSGVLRQAWDFSTPEKISLPSEALIGSLLQRVGWEHVIIRGQQLSFARSGMALDFGGIVKEYAADLAASQFMAMGVTAAIVELGGDIRAAGPRADGSSWTIKIRDPKKADGPAKEIRLYDGGVATSGDYERCVFINGKLYSHLLSPKTGWPVQGLASVTVIAPQCVVAGSAATIAMLKGVAGRSWLENLGVEFYAIDAESV